MSIRRSWTIALMVGALVPALVLGGVSAYLLDDVVHRFSHDRLVADSSAQAEAYRFYFRDRMGSAASIAAMSSVSSYLGDDGPSSGARYADEHGHGFSQVFEAVEQAESSLCAVVLADRTGLVVESTAESLVGTTIDLGVNTFAIEPGTAVVSGVLELPGIVNDEGPVDRQFAVASPVYSGDRYRGLVIEVIDLSRFTESGPDHTLFDSGRQVLIDSSGAIAAMHCGCEYEDSRHVHDVPGLDALWRQGALTGADEGDVQYDAGDERWVGYYHRIPETGWVSLSSVGERELDAAAARVVRDVAMFVALLALVALLAGRLTVRWLLAPLEHLTSAIRGIARGDWSARSGIRSGSEIGEISRSFDDLMDMLQAQTARLARSEERHRAVMDVTEDVIFEWDIETDVIEFSHTWQSKFGQELLMTSATRGVFGFANVNPEDYGAFTDLLNAVFMERRDAEGEYRLRDVWGRYVWVHVRVSIVRDERGEPVRAVGIIIDVNEQKIREAALVKRTRTDELSTLYNRSGFQSRAVSSLTDALTLGRETALLFIDVDDFKVFNDEYGHAFGDRVIRFIGETLGRIVEGIGFAGRLGGDEFALFITDPIAAREAHVVADRIIEALGEGIQTREGTGRCVVRCSIGIATGPADGVSYAELLDHADAQLYGVKVDGKGKYGASSR